MQYVQANRWRLGMSGGTLEDVFFSLKKRYLYLHHPYKTVEIHTYPMLGNRLQRSCSRNRWQGIMLPTFQPMTWSRGPRMTRKWAAGMTGMTEVQHFWDKTVMKTHWAAYIVWDSSLENPTFWPSKVIIFQTTCTYRSNWRIIRYFLIKQIDFP